MPCVYNANTENLVSLTAELALRVLLQNKISLIEFVDYVVDQRNILLQNVSGISTPLWKYDLLTDKSIERFMSQNKKKKQLPENKLTLNSLNTMINEESNIITGLYTIDQSNTKNSKYTLESVETTYSSSDSYSLDLLFNNSELSYNSNFIEESPNKASLKKKTVLTHSTDKANSHDINNTHELRKNFDQLSIKKQIKYNEDSNFNIKKMLALPPDFKPHTHPKPLSTDNILVQILCTPIIKLNPTVQTPFFLSTKEAEEVKPAS